jgi:hypothetical protein
MTLVEKVTPFDYFQDSLRQIYDIQRQNIEQGLPPGDFKLANPDTGEVMLTVSSVVARCLKPRYINGVYSPYEYGFIMEELHSNGKVKQDSTK